MRDLYTLAITGITETGLKSGRAWLMGTLGPGCLLPFGWGLATNNTVIEKLSNAWFQLPCTCLASLGLAILLPPQWAGSEDRVGIAHW